MDTVLRPQIATYDLITFDHMPSRVWIPFGLFFRKEGQRCTIYYYPKTRRTWFIQSYVPVLQLECSGVAFVTATHDVVGSTLIIHDYHATPTHNLRAAAHPMTTYLDRSLLHKQGTIAQ